MHHLVIYLDRLHELFVSLHQVSLVPKLYRLCLRLLSHLFPIFFNSRFHGQLSSVENQNAFDAINLQHSDLVHTVTYQVLGSFVVDALHLLLNIFLLGTLVGRLVHPTKCIYSDCLPGVISNMSLLLNRLQSRQ